MIRRFFLATVFLVGIWALLTAVADRASAEEGPSGPVVETLGTVEESGITDPVEGPGSGSQSDTSGPDGDQVDQPDGTQPGPTDEPVDPPADDTDPPDQNNPPPQDNQLPKDNQPPDDGGEPVVVVPPVVDPVEPPPVVVPVVVEVPPVEVLPVEPVIEVVPAEVVPDISATVLEELVDLLVDAALPPEPELTTCAAAPSAGTAALVQAAVLPAAPQAGNPVPTTAVGEPHASSIPLQTPLSSPLPAAPTGLPVAPSAPSPAGSSACATTSVSGSGSSSGDRHDSLAAALAAGLPAVLALAAVDAPSAPAGDLAHCITDGTDRPD